jgi:2-methylcitrate dehydratase
MSTIVERIGAYAGALQWSDIDAKVADYAKRILLDSLACAYGGLDSAPAQIVRKGISELDSGTQATLIGMKGAKANAQFAALANGVAIRYQDYSDVYFGPAWTAHPSDTLAAVPSSAARLSKRKPTCALSRET